MARILKADYLISEYPETCLSCPFLRIRHRYPGHVYRCDLGYIKHDLGAYDGFYGSERLCGDKILTDSRVHI